MHNVHYGAIVMQREQSFHLGDDATIFYNASHSGQISFIGITQLLA